jgi:acyl-CoA synthetase (AMP-forming)/AMP-acid ligase II
VNIADGITYQARTRPHAVAVVWADGLMRFVELEAAVRRAASRVRSLGVAPGDFVGLSMRGSALHLVLLLALARAGAVSVPFNVTRPARQKRAIAQAFGVSALIAVQRENAVDGTPTLVADASWLEPQGPLPTEEPEDASPERPWRLALTSGTTGLPKGVLLQHGTTLEVLRLQQALRSPRPGSRFLSFVDLSVSSGLYPCLRHLVSGDAVVFPKTVSPSDLLEAIDRHGITHSFLFPVVLRALLRAFPDDGALRWPGMLDMTVSGSVMDARLANQVRRRLTQHVFSSYGTTETSALANGDSDSQLRMPESSGRIVPWIQAQAVDDRDRALPPGSTGLLRYAGVGCPKSYYRNPEATAKAMRGGWFYPGDIGRVMANGILVVETRVGELIELAGGARVNPQDIEQVLLEHEGVEDAAAFSVRNASGERRLMAAVVVHGMTDLDALLAHARVRLAAHAPDRIVAVPSLPRNAAGKLLRLKLAEHVMTAGRAP